MQAGDFDGDGRADLAVLVVRIASREGRNRIPVPRPAGLDRRCGRTRSGTAATTFPGPMRGTSKRAARRAAGRAGRVLRLDGEGLVVEKESSASALIYLDSGRPRWRQYGD
jgi:hypothetical protein